MNMGYGTMVAIAAGTCFGVCSAAIAGPVDFVEQTGAVGLSHSHATVTAGPDMEFMGGGGVVADFDRDGDQDLFVIGGSGGIDLLYWNDGNGNFTEGGAAAGVARSHRGSGAAAGDYDNDGDLDIMVTSTGSVATGMLPGQNIFYRNNGDGTFTDVTATAGVATNNPNNGDAFSPAFGDYDLDGDLDLAVAGWLGGNRLYRNNGDGTFTDVTVASIVADMSVVRGFAPQFVDMDGDLYPEILWVSDFFTSKYLVNNGDGTFTDQTVSSGTGLDSNGMGNTFGDLNNDGLLDWYATSRISSAGAGSGNMFYRATGVDHVYEEVSVETGCNFGYWGWGASAIDFDQDGWLDIIATNGFTVENTTDPTVLFINDGTGNFVESAAASGITDTGQGRGLLNVDLENDGDQDVLIFNNRQPMVCLRNDSAGGAAITLEFNTDAVDGLAPDGFGTRVELTAGGMTQVRYLSGGSNYLAQSELSVHFGIGSETEADIDIYYADGSTDSLAGVSSGRYTITARECIADFAPSGNLNFLDVSAFLGLFSSQHPQADLTVDGSFNFLDISAFLSAYGSGCP
ncbi:MAG: CRTAC1 family protein [Phycisphaerales bacterium]|nr:CRTAC1 family protein [Phycisphaerales bacterium]